MSKIKIELTERELEVIVNNMTDKFVKSGDESKEFWDIWLKLKAISESEKQNKELNLWAAENGYFWEGIEDV